MTFGRFIFQSSHIRRLLETIVFGFSILSYNGLIFNSNVMQKGGHISSLGYLWLHKLKRWEGGITLSKLMEYLTAPTWSWACSRRTLIWTPGASLSENSRHFATPPLVNFPAKLRLRNERRNFILMTCHYPDLDSASDWLKQISHAARPNRSTQISDVIWREKCCWCRKMSSVFSSYEMASQAAKTAIFS